MTPRRTRHPQLAAATFFTCVVALSACGSDAPAVQASGSGVLSGVCPDDVVIQADWEPEAEHGGIYELVGDDYVVDTDAKSVTGPLVAGGEDTGVTVEIRIGGSSVGYQSAQSLLYQDRDILLGYGRVGDNLVAQTDTPVTAVLSSMNTSPYAIYWDPATYPQVTSLAGLADTDATIYVGSLPETWIDYLIGRGILDADQIDRSDAAKPATFVSGQGRYAEVGFITAEPYMYQYEIPEWGKPVVGDLIANHGFEEYFQALSVRSSDVEDQADCLAALVPIMQQAQVDYATDPTETNELIVDLVSEYDTGWVYTEGAAEYAHDEGLARGIVANGADGVMGSFDEARVQGLMDIVSEYAGVDIVDITPEDMATNRFLDPSIALP